MASLAALALLAVPALAGSSLSPAEVAAESDVGLTLTITEPEDEAYGETVRVTVIVPSSFTVLGCQQELTWDCSADAAKGRVTFSRLVGGASLDTTLQFSVTTPAINGRYGFGVVQADDSAEPATTRSAPKITVTGGQDPAPAPDDSGGTDDDTTRDDSTDSGTATDDTSTDSGSQDTGGSDSPSQSSTSDEDSSAPAASSSSDDDGDASSGGSSTPSRTQGRSNGTTLEITPGEPIGEDDPTLAEPDVADDPAVAPPSSGQDTGGEDATPTMTAIAGDAGDEPAEDAGGLPWQQLLGGVLLVAGGAVVAVRRWDVLGRLREGGLLARLRGWDPLDRIRRWRSS